MAGVIDSARSSPQEQPEAFLEEQLRSARSRIRRLDLALCALVLLVGALATAVTLMLLDRFTEFPVWGFKVGFGLFLIPAGLWVWWFLLRPSRREINLYYAAYQVEKTIGDPKNSLVNWLDLREEKLPESIRQALGAKAARDAKRADIDRAVNARALLWVGTLAALLGLATFAVMLIPARTRLILLTPPQGNAEVLKGQAVRILVRVEGRLPDQNDPADTLRLVIRYSENDADSLERPFEPTTDKREFQAEVPARLVKDGFLYRVRGGGKETAEFKIVAVEPPMFTGFELTYRYPKYLRFEDQISTEPNITAMRGTEVTVEASTNRILTGGLLTLNGRTQIAGELVPDKPKSLRFKVPVRDNGTYKITFTSNAGETNAAPPVFAIRMLTDLDPKVRITKPSEPEVSLAVNEHLEVEGIATDDIGVDRLFLRMRVAGAEPKVLAPKPYRDGMSFKRARDNSWPTELEYKDFVNLADVKLENGQPFELREGMIVEYWLEVFDNCDVPPGPNSGRSKMQRVFLLPPKKKDPEQAKQEQQQRQEQQKKQQQEQDKKLEQEKREVKQPPQPGAKEPPPQPKQDQLDPPKDKNEQQDRQPKNDKQDQQPKDGKQDNQPKDGKQDQQPKDGKQDQQPKDGKQDQQPKDDKQDNQSKDAKQDVAPQQDPNRKENDPGMNGKNEPMPMGNEQNPPKDQVPPKGAEEPKPQENPNRDPAEMERERQLREQARLAEEALKGLEKNPQDEQEPKEPMTPKDGPPKDQVPPKDGPPKDMGPPKDEQPKDMAQPKDGQPKDGQPKDMAQPKDGQPKDGQPKDGQPKDGQPKDGNGMDQVPPKDMAQPKDGQPKDGNGMDQVPPKDMAQPKDGQPKDGQPKDMAQPKDGQPKDGQPKDGQPKDGQPKDGQPKDGQPKDGQPKDGNGMDQVPPKDMAQPKDGLPKDGRPKDMAQPKDGQPKDMAQPKDGQPKDMAQPKDGQLKDGNGMDQVPPKDMAQPKDGQPKDGQPKDMAQPKDGQPKDGQPKDGQPKDGQPKDGQPKDGQPKDGNRMDQVPPKDMAQPKDGLPNDGQPKDMAQPKDGQPKDGQPKDMGQPMNAPNNKGQDGKQEPKNPKGDGGENRTGKERDGDLGPSGPRDDPATKADLRHKQRASDLSLADKIEKNIDNPEFQKRMGKSKEELQKFLDDFRNLTDPDKRSGKDDLKIDRSGGSNLNRGVESIKNANKTPTNSSNVKTAPPPEFADPFKDFTIESGKLKPRTQPR